MTTFDLSPLFRSTIGFDRLGQLLESATRVDEQAMSYPPYNIEAVDKDTYRIVMAIAGFGEADIEITAEDNTLSVKGKTQPAEEGVRYLYRGIAGRAFERRFQLAEFIEVKAAKLENGLLTIELVREVPEALKPRTIQIETGARKGKVIEGSKAA
ncbi:MAG: Hsp20 family protein [Alphaproteobacteria bacterium]|nr:Hsp20 family protein [Alphaproteobacteria bacterium]